MPKKPRPPIALCNLCGKPYDLIYNCQKHCTKRCTYIDKKLKSAAGQKMDRDEAIAVYGKMFDDPLKSLGRSKYKPYARVLYNWCKENNRTDFTWQDIRDTLPEDFMPQTMRALAARNIIKHDGRIQSHGRYTIVRWEFALPILK